MGLHAACTVCENLYQMQQLRTRLGLLLSCLSMFGCGSGEVGEGPVEGEVVTVDEDSVSVRLHATGFWKPKVPVVSFALASTGDSYWLESGLPIRAELSEDGLASVWPARPADQERLARLNKILRRDTVSRGQSAFREVGESLPEFALYDQDGRLFTRDSLKGQWSVLHFVFTRCAVPEMCPASMRKMASLLVSLQQRGGRGPLLLTITLDPLHDSPGVLNEFARGYGMDDPQARFLTGPLQVVQDLKKQLGILSKPDDALVIKHTMRTILVSPELEIVHHVPHQSWSVEDFLEKLPSLAKVGP